MSRAEPVHAWWLAILIAAAFVYACTKDRDARAPVAAEQSDAAALPDSDAASVADAAGAEDDAASAASCPAPIPAGELQNRASGPSVYGRVAWTDLGWYDTSGARVCGVEGVRICLFETGTCTESDEAGQFVLNDLPPDTDVEITFEREGFYSALRLAHVLNAPINLVTTRILKESDRRTLLEGLDLDVDPAKGGLVAIALEPGEAVGTVAVPEGVEVTLLPGGVKPYYSLGMLEPAGLSSDELDSELEATRAGGWALFPSLEPGDYTVRFEREGSVCSFLLPGFGFGVDGEGHVRVRVREGFNTASVAVLCQ